MADDPFEKDYLKTDNLLKIAIAGTAAAMAFTGEYAHVGLVNLTPACMNLLKDGNKFKGLFKKTGRTKVNPIWLEKKLVDDTVNSDRRSPVTVEYLKSRKAKSLGSTAVGIAGTVSSAHTAGVNVPAAARDLNASASTVMHIAKIGDIGRRKDTPLRLAGRIDDIVKMKTAKLGIRGTRVLTSVVPFAPLTVPLSVATAFADLGLQIRNEHLCNVIAAEVHYRARMEMKTTLRGGGPATELVRELFTRRGATRVFGSYNVDAFIREPAGWMALADKISST